MSILYYSQDGTITIRSNAAQGNEELGSFIEVATPLGEIPDGTVQLIDGTYQFVPTVSLNNERYVRISAIKRDASNIIYARWPLHKQSNVALAIEPGLEKCQTFINSVRFAVDTAESAINTITSVDDIKSYQFDTAAVFTAAIIEEDTIV